MKVLYTAHYKEDSGWSNAAINNILALDVAGVDVVCRNVQLTNKKSQIPKKITELEQKDLKGVTHCIQNVLPHHFCGTTNVKKNVAYYYGESIFNQKNLWHLNLDLADEVWVTNNELKDHTQKLLNTKVKSVPQAVQTEKYKKKYKEVDFGTSDVDFKFYFIGDINDRKNLKSIIKCYYRTFNAGSNTMLFIKVKKFSMSSQALDAHCRQICSDIQKEMRIYSNGMQYASVKFITANTDEDFIYSLHQYCDCFIGASHGEAWSLPAFDAMCFGSTPICSDEGGPKEFIDKKNKNTGTLIEGQYGICNEQNGAFPHIFTGSELWFDPSEEHLCNAMKYYYDNKSIKDINNCHNFGNSFSLKEVGKKMKELLYE